MFIIIKILAIIVALFILGIIIFAHELGHFLAARWTGMRAEVFSLGMGPAIWRKKIGGTEFRISWIPFGGYVSLPQLDPEAMETIQGKTEKKDARPYPQIVWWKRIIAAAAGSFGNLVFAIILALVIWAMPPPIDKNLSFGGAVVGVVDPESPAAVAGLRVGDKILATNGNKTETWHEFLRETLLASIDNVAVVEVENIFDGAKAQISIQLTTNRLNKFHIAGIDEAHAVGIGKFTWDNKTPAEEAGFREKDVFIEVNGTRVVSTEQLASLVRESGGETLAVRYLREDKVAETTVRPVLKALPVEDDVDKTDKIDDIESVDAIELIEVYQIGAQLVPVASASQWLKHRNPVDQIKGDYAEIKRILGALVTPKNKGESGRAASNLGGPVIIVTSIWLTIFSGFAAILGFMRFININLAILNMLPLPVLDGGHIMFALWRGITGREIHPKILNALVMVFAFLLIGAILLLTYRDSVFIWKIFR